MTKYNVIYADPPWLQENKNFSYMPDYPMMKVEEICALDIPSLCDKNCLCFLWVTSATLPWGLSVMKAWGFKYKQVIIWDKVNNNVGYWLRNRCEILLMGVKYPTKLKPFRSKRSNIISQKKTRLHSEKPVIFYELIEELTPGLLKIELFARKKREGWDSWGNEIENDTEIKTKE